MNTALDVISATLGAATGVDPGAEYKAMIKALPSKSKISTRENLNEDYTFVRANLRSIIAKGMEAVDGVVDLASESQAPRVYESASLFLKTLADINMSLLDVSDKKIKLEESKESGVETSDGVKTITNNNTAVFLGTTEDLLSIINNQQQMKVISPAQQGELVQ